MLFYCGIPMLMFNAIACVANSQQGLLMGKKILLVDDDYIARLVGRTIELHEEFELKGRVPRSRA